MGKLILSSVVLVFAAVGCTHHDGEGTAMKDSGSMSTAKPATMPAQMTMYTCSMHPDVVMDKPGNCPRCGMKMVAKY